MASIQFERDVFCITAPTFAELPSSFALPSSCFVALLVADITQAEADALWRFAETLLASGCVYFCSWGPGCERAHDIMDLCFLDKDPLIITTWHDDESIDETLYFFLRNTWPADENEEECGSSLVITVGRPQWAEHVERRLRNRDSLVEDVLSEV